MTETSFFTTLLRWQRLRVVLLTCFALSIVLLINWTSTWWMLFSRLLLIGFMLLVMFTALERWPRQLPPWLARWVLQLLLVAVTVPIAAAIAYTLTTLNDTVHWTHNKTRMSGYGLITGVSLLVAPWVAMCALYRQISGIAERQALAFELERSEFARKETDSRLRLLQAQIEPHFLFNTLANVRELVDSGSPQASPLLNSLIAYLRAAVPRLHDVHTTLAQEMELVRAYLDIMHMRMPDRLQFTLQVDDAALALRCPPMTLLTLVENAVKHGIDPSEEGGRIEVRVRTRQSRCYADVIDTGVGLHAGSAGLGTGLDALRERLRLTFGPDISVQLSALAPHGAMASIEFPAVNHKS